MKHSQTIAYTLAVIFCASAAALAPRGGDDDLDLTWHTIDGGGGYSAGVELELTGTIGQPEAGVTMSGGEPENIITLTGGFWAGTATPDAPDLCPEDLSGDDMVDVVDLLAMLGAWGPCTCPEDINNDGQVDTNDLLAMLGAWGVCPE